MTILTPLQTGHYAQAAGFSGSHLAVIIAIAGAESSYNTAALGDVPLETATWGPSVGLWQVRSLKAEYGTGQDRDASRLTDPAFNARSAHTISGGSNFSAWTTYTNGAYKQHLAAATAAAKQLGAVATRASSPPAIIQTIEAYPLYAVLGLGVLVGVSYYGYRYYVRRRR